jgi:hypothetical protein
MRGQPRWVVIVVRAWRDPGNVRARVIRSIDGGEDGTVVVEGSDEVASAVAAILEEAFGPSAATNDDGAPTPG